MSHKTKIVMVGGGSYNWCPRLLSDLIQTDELIGSEIILLDPNLDRPLFSQERLSFARLRIAHHCQEVNQTSAQ